MTRTAISPRFAINTLENTPYLHPMSFTRAKAALEGTRFADLRWVPETESTNADVLEHLAARAAAEPGSAIEMVLVADHQRAGRGRLGRTWEAPPAASLLMTVGTTAAVADAERGLLLTAMALAAAEAIEEVSGVGCAIKWPNDLVVQAAGDDGGDRKLAGVLAESIPLPDGRTGYAVGIGINCNWAAVRGPLAGIATSLDVVAGSAVDREALAAAVLGRFAGLLGTLESGAPAASRRPLVDAAQARSATIGTHVRVTTAQGPMEGDALGLADDGALLVDTGGDEPERVVVGDVVSLRPA